ncbi:MAG: pyridoxal-phosphate dependent enzyme [Actinomycetota bacterium]|nr:pyridoxal-phosphate dependent enzyme [Actinomycetota bacterium]
MSPTPAQSRRLRCPACGAEYEVAISRAACQCGSPLDLVSELQPLPPSLAGRPFGLARYAEAIALAPWALERAYLGAGMTPLLPMGQGAFVKCDFISPTGSFKDRGAAAVTAVALELGAVEVVVDSSGNAAAALAAHAVHAGLKATVVVPEGAPEAKLAQAQAYGAEIVSAPGPRERAAEVAKELSGRRGCYYAGHAFSPFFLEGTKSWAFEVFEQLGAVPGAVVMPVGNGSLLLGVFAGFAHLAATGAASRLPRLVAVQSEGCAPLAGRPALLTGHSLYTDGIAISKPVRMRAILDAIAATGGEVVVVSDAEVKDARLSLASSGLWVEPTAAAAWAGLPHLSDGQGPVVVNLGGAGFKRP